MKILKNSRGFTLIEIMAAMGVVAIALMGILSLSLQNSKMSKSQDLDLDFAVLESNVQTALSYDCVNVLNNMPTANLQYNTAAGASPVPSFGPIILFPSPSPSVMPSPIAVVGSPSPGMQVQSLSLNKTLLKVTTAGNRTLYLANFNITAQKVTSSNTGILPGTKTYSKDIPLLVWVDNTSNAIVDCQTQTTPTGTFSANPTTTCPGSPVALTYTTGSAIGAYIQASPSPWVSQPATPVTLPSGSSNVTGPTTPQTVTYTLTVISNSNKQFSTSVPVTYSSPCSP